MKNENKCFFSVSLENGITITGNNPVEVKDFLLDLSMICTDSLSHPANLENKNWRKYIRNIKNNVDNGWLKTYNHIMNKEEEK